MTTESQEQKEVITWYRQTWPQYALSLRVSQNGGFKGKGRAGAIRTAKAKGQGAITGEADMVLLLSRGGYGSLVIEHKGEGQAHKVSPAQQEYLDYHNSIGNCAISTRGTGILKAAITAYMNKE